MPPRKEPCRNFQRGSCQYGERCKFLHVTQQQPKANVFGYGVQSSTQLQRSNLQQHKPNSLGFGVQGSPQARGANGFGSKQDQFKPYENTWTRFSPINAGGFQASQQPDNQPPTAHHKCTDPELCKGQISEDFQHERPLWKLTCYGHGKSSPCDISGDISFEELRAAAYDDAKRGLSLQSIVERERTLLNTKLLEFESLLRNPYVVPLANASRSVFPGATHSVSSLNAQNSTPPPVSSFSQLGASLNTGFGTRLATPSENAFHSAENSSQTTSVFGTNNSPFGTAGSHGSQPRNQSFGAMSPQIPSSASIQSPILSKMLNSNPTAIGQLSENVDLSDNMPKQNGSVDDNIWLKEEWISGEIPEEAPPDRYIF
ncbi:zinc finger CCCH domain-containing protein 46 isoform X2 [Rhododendron vialii]|uniref:zinc finger CCCH domain-containing protein 46 isoform X2 n=1 Tax=Rhododendron vialii TaxID=182163 RepID=UPI00265EF245|nr:zinc finger CCCH domain-containing protein 46 isoform X2 [Rhododendron vialii]